MPIKNILILAILLLIILLPFVTKANDNEGPSSVRILREINYTGSSAMPREEETKNTQSASAGQDNQSAGGSGHLFDIYIPTKSKTPTPLVVFIHGGAWWAGSKDEAREVAVALCRQGFAVASINYRLSQEAIFPAQIYDCKAAIRFLRAHAVAYNIDPERIGVWGVSAGGHLAALIGTTCGDKQLEGDLGNPNQSSCVQAVCDWCGPTDFVSIAGQAGSRTKIDFDTEAGPVAKLLGGLQTKNHDLAAMASPINHLQANDPPFFIVHGDIDDLVPYEQSKELEAKLTSLGVPNKLITISGGSHLFTTEEQINHMIEFFKETLIKGNRKFSITE